MDNLLQYRFAEPLELLPLYNIDPECFKLYQDLQTFNNVLTLYIKKLENTSSKIPMFHNLLVLISQNIYWLKNNISYLDNLYTSFIPNTKTRLETSTIPLYSEFIERYHLLKSYQI